MTLRRPKNIGFSDLLLYLHGAAAFQYLYAGVKLGLFELLHKHKTCAASTIRSHLKLASASARCLLFGLSALKLITKNNGNYHNSEVIEKLFEQDEWEMFKKWTELEAAVMYVGQQDFVQSLKQDRNVGLKRFHGTGKTIYDKLGQNSTLHKIFFDYMQAYSAYAFRHLLKKIDFKTAKKILDVGAGGGGNAIQLARKHPHLTVALLDLHLAQKLAEKNISRSKLSKRIKFQTTDIFKDDFPNNQDCVLFVHQLVIWSKKQNLLLLIRAYKALNKNGRVIIFSSIANDSEDGPLMAALDTIYFKSIAAGEGMIYPWKDYEKMLCRAGFKRIKKFRCKTWTPHGIIIATK